MPFLRLTRDRRGTENTFLLHADRPGDRPKLLYWYRTAPGILLGRAPLDEDAIRTIEDQHPEIEFDWPAILALSAAMTPEDEAPARPRPPEGRRQRSRDRSPRPRQQPVMAPVAVDAQNETAELGADEIMVDEPLLDDADPDDDVPVATRHTHGLLEELVGREIATRLRARHSELSARIHERHTEAGDRDRWMARAESLNPDMWLTPEAVLDGVRGADGLFESLRHELLG